MAEKQLNVRVQLKYDTYANWTTNNPVLKAGEMAIATIASGNTQEVNSVTPPQVLIKVGDGSSHYNSLPFVSAKAADVYSWAKAETKPTYSASEITGLSDYISGEIQDTDTQYKLVKVSDYSYKLQSKALNGTWADVDGSTIAIPEGHNQTIKGNGTEFGADDAVDIVSANSNLTVTADTSAKKITLKSNNQRIKSGTTTFGDDATINIVGGGDIHVNSSASDNSIMISGTFVDTNQTVKAGDVTFGNIDVVDFVAGTNMGTVVGDASKKTITINGKDWEPTITAAVNAVATAAMEFKGATSVIPMGDLRKGDTYKVSGSFTIPDTGDAEGKGFTAKVGDTIVYDGSKWYLIPSGDDIEDTWRPITGVDNDASLSFGFGSKITGAVANNGKVTIAHSPVGAPSSTGTNDSRTYINGITTDGYGHITGYTTHTEENQDLSGKADKVIPETPGNFAGLDKNGNLIDSGKKAADFATAAQGKKADSALQEIEAGTGLKVSAKANNKQTINIDDSVTFVFNCGSSSTLVD